MLRFLLALLLITTVSISYAKDKKQTKPQQQSTTTQSKTEGSDSGKGLVVYKVDGDPGDVMIALKGNLEAAQIIVVTTTDPVAPLANNVKLFPDYKKLKVDYMQNFLVTSMATLYKIVTNDPNAIALSPFVITIYQYEGDDKTYIVRTRPSLLLDGTKYPQAKEAVEELEKRIDNAIKSLM
ncbi:hypothetical protein [Sulfurihydrogenibium azorense]|jgi:uncharacterized protein (DUF302 family)|uniref:DUF302 domain-containing protein n=1 Tax=Sulfurihydrogenibium azorense (strain DSM 15241 / OCM 825 / Az-Fu1) TaxID=204536 RepID=C1DX12_SULAA|nr:hypothetical protein [Sulfurihydrogenibium azorense]ACN99586.1 hypothetical protein SULAZ_1691 [Sulfurihydrogenibium azorense Az-Fu1]MDM7274441.1 hypothetical protein [Sulfurihydrogenibium azorense]